MKVNWKNKLLDKNVKVIGYATEGLDYIYEPIHDNWFSCIDDLEDWFEGKGIETPKYAYGSYFKPFELDTDWIIKNVAEDEYDDEIIDRLDGIKELKIAIEQFNKTNKSNGSYQIDYTVIVKLYEM